MSTLEIGPASLRPADLRAALRRALRRGDAISAARAWERLRVHGAAVAPEERAAARVARLAVGRAIREARWRRLHAVTPHATEAAAAPLPVHGARARRVLLAAVGALLLVTLFLVVRTPSNDGLAPAAAAPELETGVLPSVTLAPGGRGRTTATLAPVAVATPVPATPSPTAETAATPPPKVGPPNSAPPGGVAGGVPGGVTGGVVGGTPGGVVGGVIGGTGTQTQPPPPPPPAPSVYVLPSTPPPLAAGQDRFLFRVVDSQSGIPLSNVCVSPGLNVCRPEDPHTNVLGYYWFDLNPTMATAWNFRFFLEPDYYVSTVNRSYRPGMGTSSTTVLLRHK